MPKYEGYVENVPAKKGDIVTIRKGVRIRCTWRGIDRPAGRTYKVTVDHTLCGTSDNGRPTSNPKIRWAGSGGYWFEVDVNDVPELA